MPDITDISISVQGNPFLYFVLVIAGIILTYIMYRQTVPPVDNLRKIALGIIRGTALFLIVSMLFSPVIVISTRNEQKPVLAVIADNTKSMKITDNGVTRGDELLGFIRSSHFRDMVKDFDLRAYGFSRYVSSLNGEEFTGIDFSGEGTDIAGALKYAAEDEPERPLNGMILISDGAYNLGSNPVRAARETGIPVYTLITGSAKHKKDILISAISYNEMSYTDTEIRIDVTIRNTGYQVKSSTLVLKENDKVLSSRIVQLPDEGKERLYTLSYSTETQGMHRLDLELSQLEEESSNENNSREFFIKVLKSRIKILTVAGRPSNDYRYLMSSLKQHENFDVTGIVRKQAGFYTNEVSSIIEGLQEFDLIALIDYPADNSDSFLQAIQNNISSLNIPLLYIRGSDLTKLSLSSLTTYLSVSRVISQGDPAEVYIKLTADGADHPVFRIRELDSDNMIIWNSLPPVLTGGGIPEISLKSLILGTVDSGKNGRSPYPGNTPLVFSGTANGRKILFFNIYDFWKWKMIALRDRDLEEVYDRLIENAIKWLTNREDSKKVRMKSSRDIYRNGEKVVINAQVYDDNYEPVENAETNVTISNNGVNIELVLQSVGEGLYEAESEILQPGQYEFSGRAVREERVLGEDNGSFVIDDFSIEMQRTAADSTVMMRIADATGGKFLRIEDAAELGEILIPEPVIKEKVFELEIWNRFWLMILIISLFSIEWFFSKRWGML